MPAEHSMTDEARALAEAARGLTTAIERLNAAPIKNGNGNGRASAMDIITRIVVGLALAGAIAAHGFLWYLNATIAVQTEQIQRLREDVMKSREELRMEIRENRDEFVKANTERINALDTRVRRLERGR